MKKLLIIALTAELFASDNALTAATPVSRKRAAPDAAPATKKEARLEPKADDTTKCTICCEDNIIPLPVTEVLKAISCIRDGTIEPIITLGCGHSFCRACIEPALREKRECPNCRQAVEELIFGSWGLLTGHKVTDQRLDRARRERARAQANRERAAGPRALRRAPVPVSVPVPAPEVPAPAPAQVIPAHVAVPAVPAAAPEVPARILRDGADAPPQDEREVAVPAQKVPAPKPVRVSAVPEEVVRPYPLHDAIRANNLAELTRLLEAGFNARVANDKGNTPLHVAAAKGHLALAELLLKHNAKIAAKNTRAATPAMLAHEHGHDALATWLEDTERARQMQADASKRSCIIQ